jgi:hypothetical protein
VDTVVGLADIVIGRDQSLFTIVSGLQTEQHVYTCSTHNSQSPSLPHTRTLVEHIYPSPDCTLALDSEERIDTPKRARLANDLNMPYRSELKRPDLKGE